MNKYIIITFFITLSSFSQTIVTSLSDDGSPGTLRHAILNTAVGGTIVFDSSVDGGTLTLTADLPNITQNLTIIGNGVGNLTISGVGLYNMFQVSGGAQLTISGITFSNNKSNNGSIFRADNTNSSVIADSINVTGNSNSYAFYTNNPSTITITNSTFTNNSGILFGSDYGSTPSTTSDIETDYTNRIVVTGCTFSFNTGTIFRTERFVKIDDCIFNNNTSQIGQFRGLNRYQVLNSTFSNNTGSTMFSFSSNISSGWGLATLGTNHHLFDGNTFTGNIGTVINTGTTNEQSKTTISNNIFASNGANWTGSPAMEFNNTIYPTVSAPTTISGATDICNGSSTILTSSGGSTDINVVDVWYADTCGGEAFSQGWDTQSYDTVATTVNSVVNGILNVTTTSTDPMINMFNLGSFDPSVYSYINIRYKVVSGTAGEAQIFFLNSAITTPNGGYYLNTTLISDNTWHIATLDMSAHANWMDSNITGWRFDYATASGATLDIDFIELGSSPIVGTGSTITVTPNADTSYYVKRKGPYANTACTSQLVTVNPLPAPTFTTQAEITTAINSNVTYTTEAGQSNYVWTIPGVLNTDYSITSGGTITDHSVVLKWLTNGSKTITVNYTNSNNCSASEATSSTSTNVLYAIINKNGGISIEYSEAVNEKGEIGSGNGVNKNGKLLGE